MTNDELLHKWVNKTISASELDAFKLRPEYDELMLLYKRTEGLSAPEFDKEAMLREVLDSSKHPVTDVSNRPTSQTKERKMGIPSWMKMGLAACLLVCVGYFSGLFNNGKANSKDYVERVLLSSKSAGALHGRLPDMSAVVLAANSELYYDKEDWARKVNLRGEAFFRVTKGSKFSVKTKEGVVSVVGTEFNVKSRDKILEVSCKEGSVQVKSKNYNETLRANDSMKLLPNGKSITKLQFTTKMRKTPLSEVLDALGYQYDRKVTHTGLNVQDIVNCNFTHTNLSSALKTSVGALGINYDVSEKGVIKLSK